MLDWNYDGGEAVPFDSSIMFGEGYDFTGLESASQTAAGPNGNYLIWPQSPKGPWSMYRDSDGALSFEAFATEEECKQRAEVWCLDTLTKWKDDFAEVDAMSDQTTIEEVTMNDCASNRKMDVIRNAENTYYIVSTRTDSGWQPEIRCVQTEIDRLRAEIVDLESDAVEFAAEREHLLAERARLIGESQQLQGEAE